MVTVGERVRLSVLAVLMGWFAASCATLPFEVWELVRNAPLGQAASDLAEGGALWFGFTLLVMGAVWLVLVLAIAVLVPPRFVVRHRVALAIASALFGALVVARELDLWRSLMERGPENPFGSFILHIYTTYAVIFAAAVTWAYSSLLMRRGAEPLAGRDEPLSRL